MEVQDQKVVVIEYKLVDSEGKLVDSSEGSDPLAYIHGAGQLIKGLERELLGKKAGDEFEAVIAAIDAYGERSDDQIRTVPKAQVSGVGDLDIGIQLEGVDEAGNRAIFTVAALEEETVTLDGNHPLAGMDLNFSVKVIEVRDASADELSHGHAHGPGGHHH